MHGAIPPLPQYVFMAWYLVKHRDNFTFLRRDIVWEGVDWMHLAQDRDRLLALVDTVMNFRVPQKAGKFLDS
jgi:hypothetical protein